MTAVRRMADTDLNAADELRRLAGWNQTIADWRQLLSFEPHGCFVAVENERVVGTVTTTTYEPAMAWIGMMLVHPAHRGRGIGTLLMRAAMDYLHNRGIQCIRLDATPAGRAVYEKLGFVPEWALTRFEGTPCSPVNTADARELVEADWPAVEELDAVAFGVVRRPILRGLAAASRRALVIHDERSILGYGMLRPGSSCDYLGPLVSAASHLAMPLIASLLRHSAGRPVFWDVPDENRVASELVRRFSFQPVRALTRMRFGSNIIPSDPRAQLGIADPSLG
ncbi:MAG TPA: GNAT family N-acetyltransferase [Verrucomicrobiae bacterium]|nr:GNAT family N-acetyltransferase [Verrucomicrobiae bacterium]